MYGKLSLLGCAALLLGASALATRAQMVEPTTPPDPPTFPAQSEPIFVGISDIIEYRALGEYHEPEWVTEKFVKTGKLPPVEERLPKEPMIFKTGNMPDSVGNYGDTLRHVIGGRPEGWNYITGQSQGWGGIDIGMMECLTRVGPLFTIKADEVAPMPNLAKSWEWSEDGHQLTMQLIEGAKWSDGDLFDAEDVMFYWEDHVLDPNVSPLNGATADTFGGKGTRLEALDSYTIRWTFEEAFPEQYLYQMSYGTFCPGPSHILKPEHPKYSDNTYDEYKNAFPPQYMNWPVMGAWTPVEYRPDDIIVLRRNPYFWKVDENGNQLPYLDEVHYKLSTWADRDVQAVAGTGDFSNLEQPENYVESLKKAAQENAPARLAFGARTIGYTLYPNLSANGWGSPDARGQAVRELNRNLDFRKAISYGIDRLRLGEALVKGPFTAIYPGGLYAGSAFYDKESTVYYPYSVETAKSFLEKAGLKDTDGNGIVNFPVDADGVGGQDVEIVLQLNGDYQTNKSLGEGIVAMMERIGLRVVLDIQNSNTDQAQLQGGKFDWALWRNTEELATALKFTERLAPVGPRSTWTRRAGSNDTLDLLPFEEEMVKTVNVFTASRDNAERKELMKKYQKLYTENLWGIGITQYPGALIINKRFANIPVGTPIFLFNWAEDSIIRERVFVPAEKQQNHELFAQTLPGKPGAEGPVN